MKIIPDSIAVFKTNLNLKMTEETYFIPKSYRTDLLESEKTLAQDKHHMIPEL